jgi:pimeloyl-ACP methyl ester carboxylesterase
MYIDNEGPNLPRRVHYLQPAYRPVVILLHSSMAGAKQWSALSGELEQRFRIQAIDLLGYGDTPPWQGDGSPSLDDYADLVAASIPPRARNVIVIGHSLGGAIAMRVAQREPGRVSRLVLIEPSLFSLLPASGRLEAFSEIAKLAGETLRTLGSDPARAAACFIDYWCGRGSWDGMPERRRASVLASIGQLRCEWPAVLQGSMDLAELQATLPANTLLMRFEQTVRPSREVADILADAFPCWQLATVRDAGHMGPLTHPHLVNPIVREFLADARSARAA